VLPHTFLNSIRFWFVDNWKMVLWSTFTTLLPTPLTLLKGHKNMDALTVEKQIVAAVKLLVVVAEDTLGAGAGVSKKAQVVNDLSAALPTILEDLGVPAMEAQVVGNKTILGFVVDGVVAGLNAVGVLAKAPANATPAATTEPPAAPQNPAEQAVNAVEGVVTEGLNLLDGQPQN
jgi:hypothetical protein